MVEPRIVERDRTVLLGFSFFGDPFASSAGWTEENEIGRLWDRFTAYLETNESVLQAMTNPGVAYEVHITHAETAEKGEFEIFVGVEIAGVEVAPVHTVIKVLPPSRYAVFTLQGEQIASDWNRMIYNDWLPGSGYEIVPEYGFQLYDSRFKGVQNLQESELEVYVPIR
jgi:AraC family transcriptional regulator